MDLLHNLEKYRSNNYNLGTDELNESLIDTAGLIVVTN